MVRLRRRLALPWVAFGLGALLLAPTLAPAQGGGAPPETNETYQPTNDEWMVRYYDTTDPVDNVVGPSNPSSSLVQTPPGRLQPGQVATFDASASFARQNNLGYGGTSIVNWVWDFGDGHQANAPVVQHAYERAGVYHLNLVVHDDTGWRSSKWRVIEVGDTPCGSPSQELWVPTREGVRLHGWLTLPAGPGPFPTILEYGPYAPFPIDACEDFVRSGYARAHVAAPGRDKSEGHWDMFGAATQRGGYDAVEWLASQPWSDGKVGLMGVSGPACGALLTSGARPPHLAAVVAKSCYSDMYRDIVYAGGIPNSDTFVNAWLALILGQDAAVTYGGLGPNQEVLGHALDTAQILADFYTHPTYDAYWHERAISAYPTPTAPVLYYGNERDLWPRASVELSRWISPAGGRTIIVPGGHAVQDTSGWEASSSKPFDLQSGEARVWFDRFLKGEPNGIERRPPVLTMTTYGGDAAAAFTYGRWEQLEALPSRLTEPVALYLRADASDPLRPAYRSMGPRAPAPSLVPPAPGVVAWSPAQGVTGDNTAATVTSVGGTQEVSSLQGLVYQTPVLAQDLRVNGPASLTLYASVAAPDLGFVVQIDDVWPDGSAHYVSKGALLASHRALDAEASLYLTGPNGPVLIRPLHPHDASNATMPATGGVIHRFDIEIWGVHNAFKAGHRLRLTVTAQDLGWRTNAAPGAALVYNDAAHPSVLALAELPPQRSQNPFPFE